MMKRLFALIALLLSLGVVQVATAMPSNYTAVTQDSWTKPIERTDGASLGVEEIAGYFVYCSKVSGGFSDDSRHFVPGGATEMVLLDEITCTTAGDNYMAITTQDTEGNESEFSNVGYANKVGDVFYAEAFAGRAPVRILNFMIPAPSSVVQ